MQVHTPKGNHRTAKKVHTPKGITVPEIISSLGTHRKGDHRTKLLYSLTNDFPAPGKTVNLEV